jgi:hypothetical protein
LAAPSFATANAIEFTDISLEANHSFGHKRMGVSDAHWGGVGFNVLIYL